VVKFEILMHMRKHPFLFLFIAVVILIPLISRHLWNKQPEKTLSILVLDKTVLDDQRQEHVPFFWILNHNKYVKKNRTSYDKNKDYFGFFPDGKGTYHISDFNSYSDSALSCFSQKYDMVYYTDLYGIYNSEWVERYPNINQGNLAVSSLEPSELIYGGMTMKEVSFLKKMKAQGKLIITEFNVIGSPTPQDVSREFEKEFNMTWRGWVGRYYSSLDTSYNKELPRWLKANYTKQNNGHWPFKKAGIVFVRTDDKLVILGMDLHLNTDVPIINSTEKFRKTYDLPKTMKFHYWFDIVNGSDSTDVVASYTIDVNEEGKKIMEENYIPTTFPAVLKSKSNSYQFFYFAGDFSDNDVSLINTKFKGVARLNQEIVRVEGESRTSFFWRFYRPLLSSIVDGYYNKKSKH